MGTRSPCAIGWHRKGRTPVLREESSLIKEKAALATESRRLKWCEEWGEGDNSGGVRFLGHRRRPLALYPS